MFAGGAFGSAGKVRQPFADLQTFLKVTEMFVSLKIPIATVIVCFFFGSFPQDVEDKLPPEELRGKGFDPGDRKFWRGGLADWDRMSELAGVDMMRDEAVPENFVKARIFGFKEYNNGKNIDKIVTDKLDLEFLRKSIHPGLCRRELISDFSNIWGSAGFGAYLGVIQISTETENYIIGVSHTAQREKSARGCRIVLALLGSVCVTG